MHQGIRVASLNIQHGLSVGPTGPTVDHAALARSCSVLDADVLAVQEVDVGVRRSRGIDQVAVIEGGTGLRGVFVPTIDFDGGRYGHALFARGEIAVLDEVRLETRGAEARTALVAEVLLVAERRLQVVSAHLSVDRSLAHAQLAVVAELLHPAAGPCVFLGDCNLPRRTVRAALAGRGLVVARSRPTFPAAWAHRWIDHVAVGGGLEVVSSEVRRLAVSDHRALAVTLV